MPVDGVHAIAAHPAARTMTSVSAIQGEDIVRGQRSHRAPNAPRRGALTAKVRRLLTRRRMLTRARRETVRRALPSRSFVIVASLLACALVLPLLGCPKHASTGNGDGGPASASTPIVGDAASIPSASPTIVAVSAMGTAGSPPKLKSAHIARSHRHPRRAGSSPAASSSATGEASSQAKHAPAPGPAGRSRGAPPPSGTASGGNVSAAPPPNLCSQLCTKVATRCKLIPDAVCRQECAEAVRNNDLENAYCVLKETGDCFLVRACLLNDDGEDDDDPGGGGGGGGSSADNGGGGSAPCNKGGVGDSCSVSEDCCSGYCYPDPHGGHGKLCADSR
jgi:hypothetical protein